MSCQLWLGWFGLSGVGLGMKEIDVKRIDALAEKSGKGNLVCDGGGQIKTSDSDIGISES